MGVLLSLLAAVGWGASDFLGGVAGRRGHPAAVAIIGQAGVIGVVAVALAVVRAGAPGPAELWWGALAGLGGGVGVLALYWGLSVSRMSVVSPVSGVLSAGLPALAGVLLGQSLSPLAWAGVAAGIPAVALVSAEPGGADGGVSRRAGVIAGVVAGAGFALLFIGLDRAGTRAGIWPLVPAELAGTALIAAWLIPKRNRPRRGQWRPSTGPGLLTGVLGGLANLAYLAATGHGQLAVVAVVAALYPGITVVLARFVFREHWGPLQVIGLLVSAFAIAAVSAG